MWWTYMYLLDKYIELHALTDYIATKPSRTLRGAIWNHWSGACDTYTHDNCIYVCMHTKYAAIQPSQSLSRLPLDSPKWCMFIHMYIYICIYIWTHTKHTATKPSRTLRMLLSDAWRWCLCIHMYMCVWMHTEHTLIHMNAYWTYCNKAVTNACWTYCNTAATNSENAAVGFVEVVYVCTHLYVCIYPRWCMSVHPFNCMYIC